mmetsp:Transcript_24124/g.70762  ORF Transcript_24124/g.70762 Transcript_24124/m.70762 type:complete len:343 (-) Transcript_24124:170-1198(-)
MKRGGGGGGDAGPRKRKRGRGLSIAEPSRLRGFPFVLATCDAEQTAKAQTELLRLLSEHVHQDESQGDVGSAGDQTATAHNKETAADAMQRELDELRAASVGGKGTGGARHGADAAVRAVETNCKGIVLIRLGSRPPRPSAEEVEDGEDKEPAKHGIEDPGQEASKTRGAPAQGSGASGSEDVCGAIQRTKELTGSTPDPMALVNQVFRQVETTGAPCCRHLVRLIPAQVTCFAGLEEIEEVITPLLEQHFGPGIPSTSYMIALKRRNNDTFDRDALIQKVAGLVGKQHKVDLKQPKVVVIVEVFQALCGISVCHDYVRYNGLNIRSFQAKQRQKATTEPEA